MAPGPVGVCKVVDKWALEQPIGSGSFAIVWKAHHVVDVELVAAVKEINTEKLNPKLQESLASEISVLRRTRHDNCVQLLDLMKEEGKIYLVMEFCGGGDLGQYLRRYGRVPEASARYLMQQLAEGLKMLRLNNLIHRDLKPQNLLLSDKSRQPTLKIADFGFARDLQPQGMAETLCGSPLYMAPEILQFHKYDAKADLWSVGTILFELLVGKPPYTGANHMQLLQNIQRGEGARLPSAIAAFLSPPCKELLHALLRRDPADRISFDAFFTHAFITGNTRNDASRLSPEVKQQLYQQQLLKQRQQQEQEQRQLRQQQEEQAQRCKQSQQDEDVWASCVHGAFSGVQVGEQQAPSGDGQAHTAALTPQPQQQQLQLQQYQQHPAVWAPPHLPTLPHVGGPARIPPGAVAAAAGAAGIPPGAVAAAAGAAGAGVGWRPENPGPSVGGTARGHAQIAAAGEGVDREDGARGGTPPHGGNTVLDQLTGISARQQVQGGMRASAAGAQAGQSQQKQQQQQQERFQQQRHGQQLQGQQQEMQQPAATPPAPIPSHRPPALASSPVQQLLHSRETGSGGSGGGLRSEAGFGSSGGAGGADLDVDNEYTDVDLGGGEQGPQGVRDLTTGDAPEEHIIPNPPTHHLQTQRPSAHHQTTNQGPGPQQQQQQQQARYPLRLGTPGGVPASLGPCSSQQERQQQQQQQGVGHDLAQEGPWDVDGEGDDFVVVSSPGSPMSSAPVRGTAAAEMLHKQHQQQQLLQGEGAGVGRLGSGLMSKGGWGALSKAGPAFLQPVASHARTALLGAAHHAGLLISHHHNTPRPLHTPAAPMSTGASSPRSMPTPSTPPPPSRAVQPPLSLDSHRRNAAAQKPAPASLAHAPAPPSPPHLASHPVAARALADLPSQQQGSSAAQLDSAQHRAQCASNERSSAVKLSAAAPPLVGRPMQPPVPVHQSGGNVSRPQQQASTSTQQAGMHISQRQQQQQQQQQQQEQEQGEQQHHCLNAQDGHLHGSPRIRSNRFSFSKSGPSSPLSTSLFSLTPSFLRRDPRKEGTPAEEGVVREHQSTGPVARPQPPLQQPSSHAAPSPRLRRSWSLSPFSSCSNTIVPADGDHVRDSEVGHHVLLARGDHERGTNSGDHVAPANEDHGRGP